MSESEPKVPDPLLGDSLLRFVVRNINVNESTGKASVVLFVNGMVVFGDILPITAWLREWAIFADVKDEINEVVTSVRESNSTDTVPFSDYIHLTNVKIFMGGATGKLDLWRGRISEVSGWTFAGVFSWEGM